MTSPPNYAKLIYNNMTSPPKNASWDSFRWCTKSYRTIATSHLCIVHCAGSLYLPSKCHLTVRRAICECNMIHRQTLGLCFANWWLWTSSVLCMFIIMLEDQTSNCAQDIIVRAPNTLDAKSYWMVHNYERPYQMQLWWYSCADLSKVSKLYSNRCTMYMSTLHTMFHQSIFSLCDLPHYVLNTTSICAQMRLIRMVQHYTNQCANLLFIIPYCKLIPSFVAKVQLCYTSIRSTSLVIHCVAKIKTWLKTHPRVHKKVIAMYRIQDFAQLFRRLTRTVWCQLSICAQNGYRILCSSLGSSQIVTML